MPRCSEREVACVVSSASDFFKSRNNHFLIPSTRDCLLLKSSSCQPFGTSNRVLITINRKKTNARETLFEKRIENFNEIPLHQLTAATNDSIVRGAGTCHRFSSVW
jgi:hypothetical protein